MTDLAEKIAVTQQGIDDADEEIDALTASIERLTAALEAKGEPALAEFQRRSRFLTDAAAVFAGAVERYKADLRGRVEKTASDLFLAMTTEKQDYVGLVITEQYGLLIRHRDGGIEDGRSASAEQIVALALMGALQANAPLRGPIVMDTPLARLDPYHTANVVTALPAMADQVILLIQEGEISRQRVRELLKDKVVREFDLMKVSARQTRVEEAH